MSLPTRVAFLEQDLPTDEDRQMLSESVRGFLSTHWPSRHAVRSASDPEAVRRLWQGLADQGLMSLGSQPGEGGVREMVVVMEALGRAAAPIPFHGGAVLQWMARSHGLEAVALSISAGTDGDPDALRWAVMLDPTGVEWQSASPDGGELRLSGTVHAVEGASAATHLLVISPSGGVCVVPLQSSAVRLTPARVLGMEGYQQAVLDGARAQVLPFERPQVDCATRLVRLLALARALGAARQAFESAVDYAKERRQFGQPIGRFQAVAHKLANAWMALEGTTRMVEHAAWQADLGNPQWLYAASAAVAYGSTALRQVSLETHHAFGAIGYAEEHEAPRHFRRVHLDTLGWGGPASSRADLSASLLDGEWRGLPEIDLGEAGNAFRDQVRQWLHLHWSGERKAAFDQRPFHDREFDADFAKDLGATGWIGLGWPRVHGGQARTPLEQIAFWEVMEKAEAPRVGASVQANALMMHGTEAQRARYLPEILRGQAMHGMGYSEPQAGSDLAALTTSAVRVSDERGEGWVINGQKIWTTTWWGQYMFLAARTDRDAKPPHAGISMFIVPMSAPGITVKPSTTMYDGTFANIFYDNVWAAADALVGPENGGWKVLMDALANERGSVGGGIVLKVAHAFECLCQEVRARPELCQDPLVRDRLGQLAADIEVGRQLMMHCGVLAESGSTPPEMGALSKVFSGELFERFGEAALEILGPQAWLSQEAPGALRQGRFEQNLRHSLMWVISIGTNEIQRNLIAQRALGLPR